MDHMLPRSWILLLICTVSAVFAASCGIPNLDDPECAQARDNVRQFYSFHFGNDMKPTAENLKLRESYLTPALYNVVSSRLEQDAATGHDYFTDSTDYPRTFKIGVCTVESPEKVDFQIQIYWRDERGTVQKDLHVDAVKTPDRWLIDKVTP